MADFQAILNNLLSGDNDTRNQAEEQFNGLALSVKLPHLVTALRALGASAEVKTMAAVLLRRVFLQLDYGDLHKEVDPGVLRQCQTELLQGLSSEPLPPIRRKIGDAVAEMARSSIDDDNVNHWVELLSFLFECCTLEQPHLYESALHIISVVPGVFANQLINCLDVIKGLLLKALQAPQNEVQSEAFKATVAFITHLDSAQLRSRFIDMLPLLLAIVGKSVEGQEDDSLLKAFIDLGEQCPKFMRPQLDATIELMLKGVSGHTLSCPESVS
ncbi:Importin-5 [Geodia barretti]|uniref:Importin-5 n=1 Tax=Geodia barretti TaxID=519541 RepID=A0AA35R272_GEOBA|nr:Importin-5 [Geodia barretti]